MSEHTGRSHSPETGHGAEDPSLNLLVEAGLHILLGALPLVAQQ